MKTLLFVISTVFVAAARPALATDVDLIISPDKYLKASVSGTVQTQQQVAPGESRVHTATLNSKRIFQEFAVSPDDYQLVVDVSGPGELVLLPKHSNLMQPTISILLLGNDYQNIADSRTSNLHIVANIAPGAATNLFKNLAGEVSGTVHFSRQRGNRSVSRFNFSMVGHGTDPAGAGTGPALLKFKVTSADVFTQQP